MDIKICYRIFLFVVVGFLLVAQAAPKTKEDLIAEAIQAKVDQYIKTTESKCEKKVQKRAAQIVDSLLLQVAQMKTVDKFDRPAKPTKPQRPSVRVAKDTTVVKPLFDQ